MVMNEVFLINEISNIRQSCGYNYYRLDIDHNKAISKNLQHKAGSAIPIYPIIRGMSVRNVLKMIKMLVQLLNTLIPSCTAEENCEICK